MNHDALFKMLLKRPAILKGFFDVFLPQVAKFIDFDVIDLYKMDAEPYLQLTNPAALAFAARMKLDKQKRISLTRDLFVSLSKTPIEHDDQALVAGFFSAYQPLDPSEGLQLEMELRKVKPDTAREKVMNLTNPFIELGKQRGREQGEADLVLKQLARRLGVLSASQEEMIRCLPLPKIEALGEALLDFTSPADLNRWMSKNVECGT